MKGLDPGEDQERTTFAIMGSSVRFFPASIMGGRLHVTEIAEGVAWDLTRLDWWPEDELDLILAGGRYGEKVGTREGLEAVMRAPARNRSP